MQPDHSRFRQRPLRAELSVRGVLFDIDADGKTEQVAWPVQSNLVAFLFNDRNGNGVPDNGGELFGNRTRLLTGQLAANGFVALAEFDSNGDGQITATDERWGELRLWFDRNRDGKADASEIVPLDAAGVTSLKTRPFWLGRRDEYGNRLEWKTTFTFSSSGTTQRRAYYDVYLSLIR